MKKYKTIIIAIIFLTILAAIITAILVNQISKKNNSESPYDIIERASQGHI